MKISENQSFSDVLRVIKRERFERGVNPLMFGDNKRSCVLKQTDVLKIIARERGSSKGSVVKKGLTL